MYVLGMSLGIFIMVILTLICLILMIIGRFDFEDSVSAGAGMLILILVGLFGWGCFNGLMVNNTKTTEITDQVEVTRSSHKLYVEYSDKTFEFDDHKTFMEVDENTKWFKVNEYNHYGIEKNKYDVIYELVETDKEVEVLMDRMDRTNPEVKQKNVSQK